MVRSSYVRKLRFIGVCFCSSLYFVLLNNYVTLVLQKHVFFNKVRYTLFFRTFWWHMESTSQLRCVLVFQFTVSFPTLKLYYKCFSYNDIFFMTLRLRSFVLCCITYGNNVWNNVWKSRFVFVHNCDVFFILLQLRYLFVWCSYVFWWRSNYVIYWYVRITYGNDVKIMFRFWSSLWRIF